MKIGLIGLPQSGKSTLFEVVTSKKEDFSNKDFNIAEIEVPDDRLDFLARKFNPKKVTLPKISFIDMKFDMQQIENGIEPKHIKDVDEICFVIRLFENEVIPHLLSEIDALRDIDMLNTGILLSDLNLVEKRINNINEEIKKGLKDKEKEFEVLKKIMGKLEQDLPIRNLDLSRQEKKIISGFKFLSEKPFLLALNIGEDDLGKGKAVSDKLSKWVEQQQVEIIEICAGIENEILQLDENDMVEFMEDLGIKESARDKFIRSSYKTLDLISFFTVKGDETRAWSIKKDTSAWEAAGKIHSDIQRGFIKAEVISFDDFKGCDCSFKEAKQNGLLRLEGKDYIVKDGDIINFKFNV